MIDKTTPQTPPVNEPTQTTAKQKRAPLSLQAKIWRSIKLYTRILVYVPLVLLMLFAVLIGTPFGSKVTVVLVNQFVNDITAHYHSGTLNNDLKLDQLTWSMPGISVAAQDVELNWLPTCLINSQVCVSNLSASKLSVDIVTDDIPHSAQSEEAIAPEQPSHQELLLPITISLNKAQFKQVDVTVNQMTFHADELATEAIWNESGLQVDRLSSLGLMVNIPTNPTPNQQEPEDDTSENNWPLASLPQIHMPFPLKVKQFEATQSQLIIGERIDHFSLIRLGASFRAFQLSISQLDIEHDYGDVTVIGDLAFEQHYPLTLKLQANIKDVAELPGLTNHSLRLELTQDLSQLNINAIAKGDNRFNLAATVDLTSAQLAYQLELNDAYLQWPMLQPQYMTQIKQLTSKGDLHDQIAKLQGQLTTPYHPNLDIVADIDNRNKTLKVNQLSVKSIAGNIDLDGQLSYKNNLNWQANVITNDIKLQHIDYLTQSTPMTSLFSGRFTSQGIVSKNDWQLAIEQADLSGRLNGYPLNLQGNITINQALAVNADNLQAHALGAHLIVNGTADTIWDIDAELNVPDLKQWLKGGRGSIYAKVDVSGNSANPIVDVDAQINKLSYSGSKIDNVSLVANYRPYEQHRYSIDIKNSLLFWNNYKLSDLTLHSDGDQYLQQTTLTTLGDIVINSQLASTSDLDKQLFKGTLTQFNMTNALGMWQQDNPITINWDQLKQSGNLSRFCLVHPHNKLCLVNDISLGHTGQANINFSGNPGQLLAPILSKKIIWDGQAALTSEVNWAKGKKPTADLQFTLMPGNITLTRAKTNPVSIDYQQLLLHASLDEKKVTSSLSFNSSGIANWQSQLSVNITPDRVLQGNIDINELNLAPFGEFFPRLATLEGLLSSRLTLNGSLMDPRVSGNIKLSCR
ncbi:hypothetical protein GCM10009347_37440 [Shewanella algicola]|uniref:DUF490 domain-containing protein n=1 Tax=Shewanella algicola TaxID=640633 RepID=A0A9X1ZBS0_9GAMM|nr:hypothetical protein [Shewanella algicola]MCL1107432.1 hypothetical protein [Shewanella algicola]GGP68605.1 hypothetical protein GCM10009347_37440 [Shewanella algicola]